MDGVIPPGPELAPEPEELSEAISHAQHELERAVREGGFSKDPMRLPLGALAVTLGAIHKLFVATVTQFRSTARTLDQRAAEIIRHPIPPDAMARLEKAAATGADRRAAELARAHNLRSVLIKVAMIVGALLIGIGIGYETANSRLTAAVAGLNRELAGPEARQWLTLIQDNDIVRADRSCGSQGGGTACSFELWTDPPRPAAR
jgi:hypothetical protein